jgi:hypothetical protein
MTVCRSSATRKDIKSKLKLGAQRQEMSPVSASPLPFFSGLQNQQHHQSEPLHSSFTTGSRSNQHTSKYVGGAQFLDRISDQQQIQSEILKEQAERISRLRVPRYYARPVERILRFCTSGSRDWFGMLGLSKTRADEAAVKKAFRALALDIHPGRTTSKS